MEELEPVSPELLTYYWQHIEEHGRIADGCHIPSFSRELRRDLFALLQNSDAVRLIEVVTRIGNFGDLVGLASLRKAVARRLKAKGVKMPRGKRTAPGLLELVAELTPLLLHFGLPLATSDRSRVVKGLRMIAEEVGVSGDPRDELRRLNKAERIREQQAKASNQRAYEAVMEAAARAFVP